MGRRHLRFAATGNGPVRSRNLPLALTAGSSSALVYPGDGGRLGQLDFGAGPILRDRDSGQDWKGWGCYPLVPWSNRIPEGRLRYREIDVVLEPNHSDGSAIHGLGADRPWVVIGQSDQSATLSVVLRTAPYDLHARLSYDLCPDRLQLHLSVTNVGHSVVPVGLGFHPWFRSGMVRLPATQRWPGEPLPTGPPIAVDGAYDLRGGTIPAAMDACFTGLTDSWADVPGARLRWDDSVSHVVVYSAEPGWLCVEPVTMVNNGIALADRGEADHGVVALEPGCSMDLRVDIERATPA